MTPLAFGVDGAYPNPFARSTTLAFALPTDAEVQVRVYDVLGREVLARPAEVMAPGTHRVQLDANGWAAGVYVYRLTAVATGQTHVATGRVTVVR